MLGEGSVALKFAVQVDLLGEIIDSGRRTKLTKEAYQDYLGRCD